MTWLSAVSLQASAAYAACQAVGWDAVHARGNLRVTDSSCARHLRGVAVGYAGHTDSTREDRSRIGSQAGGRNMIARLELAPFGQLARAQAECAARLITSL